MARKRQMLWKPRHFDNNIFLLMSGQQAAAPVAVPPSLLISDTFTDADATDLNAHTIAPTNTPAATWLKEENIFTISSNKAVPTASASEEIYTLDSGQADQLEILADFVVPNSADFLGIVARATNYNNMWLSFASPTSLKLYQRATGTYTERATRDTTLLGLSAGTTHKLRMSLFGQRIIVDVDGCYTIDYGSTLHQTNTRIGLGANAIVGSHLGAMDNFQAYLWDATKTKLLVCDGDSLTNGYGSTTGLDYPSQLHALLGGRTSGWLKFNFGINGQTIVTMLANSAAKIDPLYGATHLKNICVVWGGTNDLQGGASAATAYANLVTLCQARQAAGYKVVVCTLTNDKKSGGQADYDTKRQAVNSDILANSATFADRVADLGASVAIGQTNSPDDLTYFLADKEHLNSTGQGIAAGLIYDQVKTL